MTGSTLTLARTMDRDSSPNSADKASIPEDGTSPPLHSPGPESRPPERDDPKDLPATPKDLPATQSSAELILSQLESGLGDDQRRFRNAAIGAFIFHALLFFVTFPNLSKEPMFVGQPGKVFVMQQTRFKKPPAKAAPAKQEIPKKKAKKIPIPDPTPDEPEPIELEEFEIPDLEPTDVTEVVFGIPDAPAPTGGQFGTGRFSGDALQIGNGVAKPVAITRPQPRYTEEARQKRIQGVVILQGIVDENGDVRNLKVVKGLPMGLDKEALEGVYQWKFKPAVFEGKPVAVHFYFNVNFWLQ